MLIELTAKQQKLRPIWRVNGRYYRVVGSPRIDRVERALDIRFNCNWHTVSLLIVYKNVGEKSSHYCWGALSSSLIANANSARLKIPMTATVINV